MRKSQIWVAYYQISRADNEAKLHMISYWPSNGGSTLQFSSVCMYVHMYLYIFLLPSSSLCHLETTITKFGFNGTPILLTAIGQERGTNYTYVALYTRIIRLPRGMRLEMRQSTSVPACSGWHLFSKSPTTIKPVLPTEMWPSVIDTPAQHLRTLFVPFATAIRHSGGEHY